MVLWEQFRTKRGREARLSAGRPGSQAGSGEDKQMKDDHFRTLFICIVLSVGLLGAVTYVSASRDLKQPPWLAITFAIAPLAYYHLFYLARRARKGLSAAAIDSVYYFGFLVTVAAL